jgi:hypothetical protein
MPEGLPAQLWNAEANQLNVAAIGELATFKQQHDERLAGLPQKADDYKVEWTPPADFKAPDGLDAKALQINPDDPRIPALRAFAHEHKLSQDQVNGLVALHVQAQLAEYEAASASIQEAMKALGENGKARVDAANTFLAANLSKEEHAAVRLFIGDAAAFTALEKLIAKATTQGIPPNGGGNPPQQQASKPRLADRFYGSQRAN